VFFSSFFLSFFLSSFRLDYHRILKIGMGS
jgi:hypothetical protein